MVLSLKTVQEGDSKTCFKQVFRGRSDSIETWGLVSGHPLHHGRCHCGAARAPQKGDRPNFQMNPLS